MKKELELRMVVALEQIAGVLSSQGDEAGADSYRPYQTNYQWQWKTVTDDVVGTQPIKPPANADLGYEAYKKALASLNAQHAGNVEYLRKVYSINDSNGSPR